jgi:hypothetical protein
MAPSVDAPSAPGRNTGGHRHTLALPTGARMTTSRPAPRHDAYRNIHKGLRVAMFDTVHRIGRLDVADTGELQAALDQAESLLRLMAQHLKHENEHMHTALEARAPGAARRTADDHVEHLESLDALGAQVAALRTACTSTWRSSRRRTWSTWGWRKRRTTSSCGRCIPTPSCSPSTSGCWPASSRLS